MRTAKLMNMTTSNAKMASCLNPVLRYHSGSDPMPKIAGAMNASPTKTLTSQTTAETSVSPHRGRCRRGAPTCPRMTNISNATMGAAMITPVTAP